MIKMVTLILIALFTIISMYAQVPQKFNYQAVVRDDDGELITNEEVAFKIDIYESEVEGSPLYSETHTVTTNNYGVAVLEIGNGSTTDDFTSIPWNSGDLLLAVSFDPEGGTAYTSMGASSILSVPYALYSNEADSAAIAAEALNATNAQNAATADTAHLCI